MEAQGIRLLALDQSSRVTGWAVFEGNKLIKYGHFTISDDDIGVRLSLIRSKVAGLIDEYKINKLVFEDIQMQSTNNVKVFKILAEVFGVIYELATELQIPNSAVLASTWRSGLKLNDASKRSNQKQHAKDYVKQTYGVTPIEDECDAICIGTYAIGAPAAASNIEGFNWE